MGGSISNEQVEILLNTLATRFSKHSERHPRTSWDEIAERLSNAGPALSTLLAMEESGGEPDVVEGMADEEGQIVFVDCAAQAPKPRVSLCYDDAALEARAKNKPRGSVEAAVRELGERAELLDEDHYLRLQQVVEVDTKSSCWVLTEPTVRDLGGAIFCDRRFGRVFTFHNGADSYYSSRGFRCMLRL